MKRGFLEDDDMVTERNLLGTVVFLGLVLALCACLGGCTFSVSTLPHGWVPIGVENRQATALQDNKKAFNARYVNTNKREQADPD